MNKMSRRAFLGAGAAAGLSLALPMAAADDFDPSYERASVRLFQDMYSSMARDKNVVLAPGAVLGAVLQPAVGAVRGSASERAVQELFGSSADLTVIGNRFLRTFGSLMNVTAKGALLKQNVEMWISRDVRVSGDFVQRYKAAFGGTPVTGFDFKSRAQAMQSINRWASDSTDGKIPQLLRNPLPGDTAFAAGGATYFKAPWVTAFDPSLTRDADFTVEGRTIPVSMMYAHGMKGKYIESASFTYAAIAFEGEFEFFAIKPSGSLDKTVTDLSSVLLEIRRADAFPQSLTIQLPRLDLATQDDLTESLQSGVLGPLMKGQDLSGIGGGVEHIDAGVQATMFRIDEKGGEAAAVAVVSGSKGIQFNREFTLDRDAVVGIARRGNPIFLVALRSPTGPN